MIRNKLKEILAKKDKRQSDLVDITGVTKSTISNIVNNKFEPSIGLAFKIADYLNMSIDEIFFDEDIELAFLYEEKNQYLTEKKRMVYKADIIVVVDEEVDAVEIKSKLQRVKTLDVIVKSISELE